MAIINEAAASIDLQGLPFKIPDQAVEAVKNKVTDQFREFIWNWYREHKNDIIGGFDRKVWFFNIKVVLRVEDCRVIFEKLAGPEPKNA